VGNTTSDALAETMTHEDESPSTPKETGETENMGTDGTFSDILASKFE